MRVSCVGLFCLYGTNKLNLGNYAQLEEYPYELGDYDGGCSCAVVECSVGGHVDVERE